jgi:serine/threonine protein kinase
VAANRDASLVKHPSETTSQTANSTQGSGQDPGIKNLVELELVSSGQASSLYRAVQTVPRRRVAVKVLHDELTSDTGQRFDRERTITGQLSGQSAIVPLFETGVTAGDEPYLVMPFYARGSLARLIADHGRLPWREAAFLIEPIAVTLAEVHSRGIVHRNLKPENILLTDFLMPRVADFDMSLPVGERSTTATTTASPFFSAPESAGHIEADPAADVYSLGAILWALLSGQMLFADDVSGTKARTATAQARTGQPAPPTVVAPDSIRDLIARSMAENTRDRPANAATFVSELRHSVAHPDETSANSGAPEINLVDRGQPARPDSPESVSATTARSPQTDARYVLMLVACISVVILAMVAAAMMTVG